MLNRGKQIHNFIFSSGSGTVINYGSGSDFVTSYGCGSTCQKVTVPMVPVPQRCQKPQRNCTIMNLASIHCNVKIAYFYIRQTNINTIAITSTDTVFVTCLHVNYCMLRMGKVRMVYAFCASNLILHCVP
jgi:hypothetical protein